MPSTALERRLTAFVDWIRPEPQMEQKLRQQSDEIRQKVRAQAHADGLVIVQTPSAGSFAKGTGLRRHMTGGSPVEGLDGDIHFVIRPRTRAEEEITELLDRFQGYVDRAYPQRPPDRSRTRSSIKLSFRGARLSYDIVPLLLDEQDDSYQILLRGDGTRRRTSVQRHVDFVKRRTEESNRLPGGRVKFNEVVRLLKWWRDFRQAESSQLTSVPTFLVDLIAAGAYDRLKVETTYAQTLLRWFDWAHGAVTRRERISFKGYAPTMLHADPAAPWSVLDPVNPKNNVAAGLLQQHLDELARWLHAGREGMQRAIDCDRKGHDTEALGHLAKVFGAPIKHVPA